MSITITKQKKKVKKKRTTKTTKYHLAGAADVLRVGGRGELVQLAAVLVQQVLLLRNLVPQVVELPSSRFFDHE